MKIAIYKRIDEMGDWESICEIDDYMEGNSRYVRLTDPLEVEFKPRPADETIQQQVDALNNQKESEINRHRDALAKLDARISKLLAITYQPEVV